MGRGRLIVFLVAGALCGAAACSSGTPNKPLGSGDRLIEDVEASTLPPPPSTDADLDPDGVFARVDGSQNYGTRYDAYAALTVCAPADGGESDGESDARPAPAATDGSAAYPADGAGATGCIPIPASCVSTPDCVCLLGALAAQIPCAYPSCGVMKTGFSVYCPP
jgi:hypothetical protein